jgi:large repetitive protein
VVVTVAGQSSDPALLDHAAPVITALAPNHGPMAGGIDLTLSGNNFGASGATVSVGGNDCPVTAQTHTSVTCTLPAGSGKNQQVVLTVGGQSSNGVLFDYDAPAIAATPVPLAFGQVLIGGPGGNATLAVSNPGQTELTVTQLELTGTAAGDYSVTSPAAPFTVAPGATQDVVVHFAPSAHDARAATLRLHSNALGQAILDVALSGAGVAPILVAGASVAFGASNVGVAVNRTVTVSNPGERDLVISQVSMSGDNAGDFSFVGTLPITVGPGGQAQVGLRFVPTAVGARAASASIVGNDPLAPVAQVALTGTGTSPQLSLAPSALDFGDVRIDQTGGPETVTIKNLGSGPLTITGVALGGAGAGDFSVAAVTLPAQIAPSGQLVLEVSYHPSAVGADSATLQITSDDPVASSLSVALSGNGVAPEFSLAPTSIDFGGQLVGRASAAHTVVISNNGSAALAVTALAVSGTDAGDFSITAPSLPASVAPGGTLEVPVVFTPAAVGGKSAELTISTDAPAAPTGEVTLTGVGLSQLLAASPLEIDFGVIEAPGSGADVSLTISNTGGESLTLLDGTIAGSGAAAFSVEALAGALAPGASRTVAVGFDATVAGSYSAQLTIGVSESGVPDVVVPLTGKAVSSLLAVAPESLDFGTVEVGSSSETKTVTMTNQSGDVLNIVSLDVADAQFAVSGVTTPASLAAGASLDVMVTFTPTAVGAAASELEVHIEGQSEAEALVPLTGEGAAPPTPDAGPGDMVDAGTAGMPDASTVGTAGGGGCGCRVGGGGAPRSLVWVLLGVALLRRRRLRRD